MPDRYCSLSVRGFDYASGDEHLGISLVGPKVQSPSSTFHNHGWAQSAENTGLVLFGGIEVHHDGIFGVGKLCVASWADRTASFTNAGKLQVVGAISAVEVAIYNHISHSERYRIDNCLPAHLHVVTTARPVTSLRHFKALQRSVNSMLVSTEVTDGRDLS